MIPFATDAAATAAANITNAFEWPEQPPELPLAVGISSRCRRRTKPRLQATCTKKLVKIARVAPKICSRTDRQTDRQTHTERDVLLTILRHRSRRRSKYLLWIGRPRKPPGSRVVNTHFPYDWCSSRVPTAGSGAQLRPKTILIAVYIIAVIECLVT